MSIISNQDNPEFNSASFSEFIEVVTTAWKLPAKYRECASFYQLKHWTAEAISNRITGDGIILNGISFMPLFSKSAIPSYSEELKTKIGDTNPKYFWLSFRAVRYPLCTEHETTGIMGNLKCYVIIRLDTKSQNNEGV